MRLATLAGLRRQILMQTTCLSLKDSTKPIRAPDRRLWVRSNKSTVLTSDKKMQGIFSQRMWKLFKVKHKRQVFKANYSSFWKVREICRSSKVKCKSKSRMIHPKNSMMRQEILCTLYTCKVHSEIWHSATKADNALTIKTNRQHETGNSKTSNYSIFH